MTRLPVTIRTAIVLEDDPWQLFLHDRRRCITRSRTSGFLRRRVLSTTRERLLLHLKSAPLAMPRGQHQERHCRRIETKVLLLGNLACRAHPWNCNIILETAYFGSCFSFFRCLLVHGLYPAKIAYKTAEIRYEIRCMLE